MDEIAKIMQWYRKTVFSPIHATKRVVSRGRRRKTTCKQDRMLVRLWKITRFKTSEDLKRDLNIDVTSRTIRNRLKEANLIARSSRKVPMLPITNIKNRLSFATINMDRPHWKNVLWSDETKINLFSSDGKTYVRRPINMGYDPKYTKKTFKNGGGSIMLWGCFSSYGVGPIYMIEGKMCAPDYLNILRTTMLPFAKEEMPLKWEFMQDNDPKHSSKLIKNWFRDNWVNVMDWPSQSPDFNPIEDLWGILKKRIGDFRPKNKTEMWEKIKDECYSISGETCENLVNSMKRRCKEVIRQKGGSTKILRRTNKIRFSCMY